ncbi:MAG TPA: glycosyltransferase family 2 protein, partial [Vicinamibacteria bacterium]
YASTRLDFEVIVADNASTDGSVEMLRERFPGVRVIASSENVGFGAASNLCWREAKASLVLFLNGDTVVPERALDRLVEVARRRPDAGAIGPRILHPDGEIQMSFGAMPGIGSEMLQKLWNAGYEGGKGPLRSAVRRRYSRERAVDWVSGACLLARRDALETVSGFDENFFLYSEDVDLCARIRSTGAVVLFTPEVEVVHLLGRSVAKNRDRVVYESHRSRLYFYEKHHRYLEVLLLRLYMTAKAGLLSVLRPRQRALYGRILALAWTGGGD